ncbi:MULTISPECIES: hypothetical protein [unclassified Microcoleus]|uniref:hypothetical protein n=1 Tax=unclassified Microcoleus TaxID=2642155 RepID=UPI002FD00BDA
MVTSDREIKAFFEDTIFDIDDDDEIDTFFNNYSDRKVIQCLFDKLKSLSTERYSDEPSWLLGGIFGRISNKYSVDTQLFPLLYTGTLVEKQVFLNFLSGYVGSAEPDVEIVVKIAEDIAYIIANPDDLKWDIETIDLGIEAVSLAYLDNKQLFHVDKIIGNKLIQMLKVFKAYLSNFLPKSQAYQLLLRHFPE